jgi:hypothetical protein
VALTRANVEAILVRRCGRLLTAADLDGTTVSGSNADLSDPIASALRALGYTVASRVAVVDGDLSGVDTADEEALLDVAELRALESALQNFDATDLTVGPRTEKLDQIGKRLENAVTRKRAQVQRDYGIGLSTLEGGVITLSFQQQNDTTEAADV